MSGFAGAGEDIATIVELVQPLGDGLSIGVFHMFEIVDAIEKFVQIGFVPGHEGIQFTDVDGVDAVAVEEYGKTVPWLPTV